MVNQATRLRPAQIQADRDAFAALQAVAGYAPANPAYALAAITAARASLEGAQQAETQAAASAAAARDSAVAREWEFHNLMPGPKGFSYPSAPNGTTSFTTPSSPGPRSPASHTHEEGGSRSLFLKSRSASIARTAAE